MLVDQQEESLRGVQLQPTPGGGGDKREEKTLATWRAPWCFVDWGVNCVGDSDQWESSRQVLRLGQTNKHTHLFASSCVSREGNCVFRNILFGTYETTAGECLTLKIDFGCSIISRLVN